MTPLPVAVLFVAAVLWGRHADAQAPKVEDVIARGTLYAHRFVDRFSNVVAEERYEQETTSPRRKRVLVSDFLLVRYHGDELWQSFRDVAEVDGTPVRDREDRMIKLFLEPPGGALTRAAEIAAAGARHNLANVGTISNPLLVMGFLQRHYVDRFRFNLAGLEKELGPDVRTVRFVEFRRPTVLRTNSNGNLASSGLIWIEEGTGRVVKTELQIGASRVTTDYAFDEELGINVPAVMEDRYPQARGEFRGRATYGKFRRFQIRTEEKVKP
jgi:hypothetical protein